MSVLFSVLAGSCGLLPMVQVTAFSLPVPPTTAFLLSLAEYSSTTTLPSNFAASASSRLRATQSIGLASSSVVVASPRATCQPSAPLSASGNAALTAVVTLSA